MRRYLIVVERTSRGFSAYTPDLPGCAGAGETVEDAEEAAHRALRLHLRGFAQDKRPVPKSASLAEYILLDDSDI